MDHFAAGDLLAARAGFLRVLELDPRDEEARAMVGRTGKAIAARVADLLEQADAFGRAGRFSDARGRLQTARDLDAEARGLAAAGLRIDRLEAEGRTGAAEQADDETPVATSTVVPPITAANAEQPRSESRKRELADLYRRGLDALEAGSADQAVHFWEMVWSADPEYQQVSGNLKQFYLGRGMEAFVAGDLQQAVRHWENAVRVAPTDEKARGYLKRAQDQLRRLEGMAG